MGIGGVLKNLVTKGPVETMRIRAQRSQSKQRKAELERVKNEQADALIGRLMDCCSDRADSDITLSIDEITDLEGSLRKIHRARYRQYEKDLKAFYLKKVLPARYERLRHVPVKDKVVFMEKNNPNSYPNRVISRELKKQGKYQVIKMALGQDGRTRIGYYENCVKFVEEIADAKAVFISSGNDVLSCFDLRYETKLIQLWHGLGMFKKCGYSTVDSSGFGASAESRMEYDEYRNYSYVCLPSMEQAWTFEDAMHIPADSGILVPVGVSRTDEFFDPNFAPINHRKLLEEFPQIGDRRIILYAPTYRGRVSAPKAPKGLDIDLMARSLSDDYVLLIRHHAFAAKDRPPIPAQWENEFAFDMNRNKIMNIEKLLAIADICITDYSSVGFEYSLLERPIAFFAFDLDDYRDERGMYWDYDELTPGPVCRTTQELVDYIDNVDERFDKEEIKAFKEKYVGACDGHSTERTIALIESDVNPRLTGRRWF